MRVAYERGLHELGDGLFAHLQPDGGWGWSNAVLICADGTSLLVDTLFEQAMNTLGNGDHYFGNQLLPDNIPIVATAAAVEEMRALPPALAHAFFNDVDPGPEFDAWAQRTVRRFDFTGIEQRLPTQTFTGRHALSVGDRRVDLVALGPAHTAGDAIAWVPDAATVFTGDILFIEGTPVMWAGPAANWLAACDRILDLDASVIVPGHGPVTDASGVRDVQRYLTCIREEARARFDAGMSDVDAADEIDLADFRDWGDRERIAVNVATL